MGGQRRNIMASKCAALVVVIALYVMTHSIGVDARRNQGSSQRKSSSNSNSGHVTQSPNSGSGSSNSHADIAKLSYPNYNSQPNRPASPSSNGNNAPAPIGWNVPDKHGPPPAYSPSNPVGGAKTNVNEPPPAYHQPNYGAAPPPSYGASNVHTPITATNTHGTQYAAPPPGATYHSAGALPPGATYYPSGAQVPAGGSYYPGSGHTPYGGTYYPQGGQMPAGASYYPSGGALPPGATYYPQAPQQTSSSGLGFGTGLIAGGLGGALLGHALTPTETRVVQAAPAASSSDGGGSDRIIIINNGVPVNATQLANGTTIINTSSNDANATHSNAETMAAPLAPLAPQDTTNPNATAQAANATADQPAPGGIICVPVRVNETDPANSGQMIEVEKIACYPAPQTPPPPAPASPSADSSAPLAPMNPVTGQNSQQLQQSQQPVNLPDQSTMKVNSAATVLFNHVYLRCIVTIFVVNVLIK